VYGFDRGSTAGKGTRHLLAASDDLPAAESFFAATTSPVVILKEGSYDSHGGSGVYVKGGSVCQVVNCTFEDNTGDCLRLPCSKKSHATDLCCI
jgi:nitrite reductase/ring-hydroxylating ferredoxin subunit